MNKIMQICFVIHLSMLSSTQLVAADHDVTNITNDIGIVHLIGQLNTGTCVFSFQQDQRKISTQTTDLSYVGDKKISTLQPQLHLSECSSDVLAHLVVEAKNISNEVDFKQYINIHLNQSTGQLVLLQTSENTLFLIKYL